MRMAARISSSGAFAAWRARIFSIASLQGRVWTRFWWWREGAPLETTSRNEGGMTNSGGGQEE